MSNTDCRSPLTTAEQITNTVMPGKVNSSFIKLLVLGILAGVYIGFGGEIATLVGSDAAKFFGFGVSKLIVGGVFSLGLMLVIIAGAELFTGNILIIMSVLSKKSSFSGLLRNWGIVYSANLIGSLLLVLLVVGSGLWSQHDYITGIAALKIANAKVNLTFGEAFTRGILCNWLVCLAVWMAVASRNVIGKIFAIFFPIMTFVALGYEHCIANMYFIPKAIILKSIPALVSAAGLSASQLGNLNVHGFVVNNLIPVTLGNIVGAAVFVGVFYWAVYMQDSSKYDTQEAMKRLKEQMDKDIDKELIGTNR
ncbi:MAG: formate/nitrite transporter family protein [bacterium]